MKRKHFILALVAMLLSFSVTTSAQELLVNCDYNSSTEGYGTTKFSNYDGAYAYATTNGKTSATIVIEKTNTISGNCFDNNHKNYSRLAVVIKDGATMGNAASKWDMTYPVTVEPGGTLTTARPASASVSYIHIKNKLIVGAKGATKKAYVNFLSDNYQDCDISIRYNGSIEVYNADFYVQDLDAQGKLTIEDSKVYIDGAFASAASMFYPTTLTNSTITINGNQISGGLSDFAGGTSNQLGNVKLNNSTLTIKEGDTKVAANVTATNSTIAVNNLTVNNGKTLNLNSGSTLNAENITTAGTGSVNIDGVKAEISGGQAFIPVAKIGEQGYATLTEALAATKTMTGDVTVEIYDKVTFNQPLIGNYTSINFVGKDTDAEMYLDVQGYTTATGKKVSFTDLKLSKSEGGFIANAGFMNVAFGIYDVVEVTYTNCTFLNGACASSGKVTFNGCTFKKSWDKYGLWAYGNVDVTVQGSTFADYRGIKMYAENGADASVEKANLTVKNTNFSAVDNKPAIVLTYGESVVLEGNTYSSTGTFELDLDGKPNGVAVTSDVVPVCVNDNGACGVLVDGKIYTTVAQAAEVATSGSTVTLLHSSNETVEFPMGVTLNKNNFEAAGVTVAVPAAKIGETPYTTLEAAFKAAKTGDVVTVFAGTYAVPTMKAGITIVGEGNVLFEGTLTGTLENLTMKNIHIKGGNAQRWAYAKGDLVFENVTFEATSVYALHFDGITAGTNLTYNNCTIIGWAAMSGSPANCTFEGCTFKGNGTYGVIRTYFDATITGCTFDVANVNTTDNYQDGIHAVSGAKVVVTNCTNENGEMKDIVNVHASSVVTVDDIVYKNVTKVGDNYYATLAEAFTAVGDGAGKTVELIADVDLAGAEWTPVTFNGVFDGQNHTISNLFVNGAGKSNQGFFAQTQNGEIKNVTFNNAKVTGRLNVGVVAGTPYTSKYTNVKVTGHVEVNGMAYVGGVGGKNAYANWTDITVDVDGTSYVKATSTENGTAYRTYVGGVIGFNGEGGHTFKNISSNIKVIGDVMDIGGIFGILHYGNNAENITFTGAVEAPANAKEVGGIAGVWHNEKGQVVTITTANSEGTVKVGDVSTTGSIVGGAYNADNKYEANSGSLIIDGNEAWLPRKVTTKAELDAAIEAAEEGDIIVMDADIDYGTTQLAITKAITLDLGGKTLTTGNAYGGMSIKGNPTVKNGNIIHKSNTAAIKVWNATAFEDLVIDVQGKGDANKTIGGIVLQSGSTTRVGSIKNVTIKGAALTNGIETYNCGDATENVIGSMENVTIDAKGTGMLISAPCGTATGCSIKGGTNAIEIWIKGNYSASLDLARSTVEGGVYAHDEFNNNPGVVNNGTLKFTADEATTGASAADVTLEIARAEAAKVQGVLNDVMVNAKAKLNNVYYATFAEAFAAAQAGQTVTLLADLDMSEILVINKAITLNGNGKTLTSTAGRAINVDCEGNVGIKNLTINASGERAINVIQKPANVTIDNVTATAANYTVNVAASAPNAKVAISNSTLNGLCTVNVAAAGAQVTVDNSTVNCNDNNTTAGESYAALCLNKAAVGGSIVATNTTVNVAAGSDSEKGRNGAENGTVTINGSTEGVTVTVAVITYPGSDNYHGFTSLADAIEFAKAGDVVSLIRDITASDIITINKAITLDGNGKKLTSTAARAINVSGADGVTIKNLTINASGERAINVIQNATNVTIENVTATAANYTVNLASSAGAAKVAISNSNLTGLNVVNVGAPGSEITINGGTITCNDQNANENYAALAMNKDAVGAKIAATGVTFDIKGDSKKAKNGAENGVITIDGKTDEVAVNVAYIDNGGDYYYAYTSIDDAIAKAKAGETITLLRDVTMDYNARDAYATQAQNIVIDGNGKTLTLNQKNSDWASFGLANNSKLILKNMTIEKTGYGDTNGAWNTHAIIFSCPLEMTNVIVNNGIAVQAGATLTNVTINEANGYYGLWVNGNGQSVTMNGGAINATNGGRGIKIADQYIDAPAQVTLSVDGTVFNTAKKAAVLVSSTAGAKITASNVDIHNVAEDNQNMVWVDEDWATYYNNVKVYDDASKTQENEEAFPIKVWYVNGEGVASSVRAYYKNLDDLFAAPATQVPGSNKIELSNSVSAKNKVNVNYGSNRVYNFVTNVAEGVTMTFEYVDNWNMLPKFNLGENITLNVKYLQVIGGDIEIAGNIVTDYLYLYGTGEGVTITETGAVTANTGDATVQVKGGTVLTVNGKLATSTLNVWTQDQNNSVLNISGANAQVTAAHLHAWNGKDGVSAQKVNVENGATLTVTNFQADRGSEITVADATINSDKITLGYDNNIGKLIESGNSTINAPINLNSKSATVKSDGGLNLTTSIPDHKVALNDEGIYVVVPMEYVAKIGDVKYESITEAITAAQPGDVVTILAGNYTQTLNINKAITVQGETNTVSTLSTAAESVSNNLVNFTGKLNITADGATVKNINVNNGNSTAGYINAKNVTVDGCQIVGGNGFRSCYTKGSVTFKNSVITGSTYGIHFDGSADGNIVIDNCIITGWTSFASTINNVAISNSEFAEGNYNQLRLYQNATIENTEFNEKMTIDFGKDKVSAEFTNCTVANGGKLTDVIYLADIAEMGINVIVDGKSLAVAAKIGSTYYPTLAEAIKAVKTGDNTIELLADCAENVTITQVNGTNITINGNGKTYTGTITVKGDNVQNNLYNTETLTFQNINFAPAYNTYAITAEKNTYARNITVDGCTFKGNNDVYGIRVRNGYNYTVKNTTAEGVYTFLNASEALVGLTVENVTVKCANVAFAGAYGMGDASFKEVTIVSDNNGVKVNNPNSSALTFENCSITAKTPVTFIENAGVTSALTAEFNGSNTMVVNNGGTYWFNIVEAGATDATFKAIVNDAALDMSNTAFVASAGNVYYSNLQKAVDAAVDGDTVTLAKDIAYTAKDAILASGGLKVMVNVAGKNITLNMNGKKISLDHQGTTDAERIYAVVSVEDGAGLTVTGNGSIDVDVNDATPKVVYMFLKRGSNGYLVIENGNFHMDDTEDSMVYTTGDEVVTINGGTFILDKVGSRPNLTPWIFNTKGNNEIQLIVNGGTFNYDISHQYRPFEVKIAEDTALRNNGDGTWTIVSAVAYITEKLGNTVNEPGSREHKVGYATLEEAIAAAKTGETVTMVKNVELTESIVNTKTVTLNLNGKIVVATDNATGSYAMITNKGNLTINDNDDGEGEGAIKLTATINRGWNAYSSVISNTVGGKLTVNGGRIEHLGGTDMAYAIDNLTNGKGTYAETVINGGVVKSTYRAVRQFLNGIEAQNILTVNGGTIEGANKSIWMQDPSKNANTGTLTVSEDASLNGDVYLTVTAGSTVWPVEVSIAAAALKGESKVLSSNVPAGYAVTNFDGVYSVEKLGGIGSKLTIVDGEYESFSIDMAEPVTIDTLTYKRAFKNAGVWQTLYVPFEIPVSELADNYEVAYVNDVQALDWNEDGTVGLNEIVIEYVKIKNGTLRANHPYVVKPKNEAAKEMELVLYDAKLYGTSADKQVTIDIATAYTKFNFKGNYSKAYGSEIGVDGNFFTLNLDGNWQKFGSDIYLGAFRVYMTMENKDGSPVILPVDAEIRSRVVGEKDEATGIITPIVEGGDVRVNDGAIYDLNGRPVRTPEKGKIYIMNGKKVLF